MELNSYIDHTNLKVVSTLKDIEKLCDEAVNYHFASVCVAPYYVSLAKNLLKDSTVSVCTVIGFPNGYSTKETKVFEAINAIENGADEIDMVINISALKNKDYDYIKEEIEEIRDSIDGHILKVIIETCYLEEDEIIKMTEICNETFVNFIKTSTGFGTRGASLRDVEIMNEHKSEVLEIKASGGIKTFEDANAMINEGATRLGTSNGVEIMKGEE
ncbi:MAG: deoxyribose-phosphate aldolase [Lactobacillales bacterium]|nr:deoxyribose-phosphate aldolase [Lactobacillales bacterium]